MDFRRDSKAFEKVTLLIEFGGKAFKGCHSVSPSPTVLPLYLWSRNSVYIRISYGINLRVKKHTGFQDIET